MLSRGKLMVQKALENGSVDVPSEEIIPGKTSNSGLLDFHTADGYFQETSTTSQSKNVIILENIVLSPEKSFYEIQKPILVNTMKDDESIQHFSDFESSGSEYIPEKNVDPSENDSDSHRNVTISNFPSEQTSNIAQGLKKKKNFMMKPKQSKKRARKSEDWKSKKAAIAREKGEEYISYKGKIVPAKVPNLNNLCTKVCRLKCDEKFTLEQRSAILKDFYNLDVNAKNSLIFKSLIPMPVARIRKNAKKHKHNSYKYSITIENKQIFLCKSALCSLYQIGRRKVDVIKEKILTGKSAPSQDQRGKHTSRPHKMKNEVIECIKSHISKFPSEESHYSRNSNPFKRYLSPTLNMSIMYHLYLEECKQENQPKNFFIKKASYANIFNTQFNLSFSSPKSDTCSTCDSGQTSDEHKENVKVGFQLMQTDRIKASLDKNICYITVDLQQTMPLPKITTSKAFYLRQLWFYNLGIHMITTKGQKAFMQTWTEDVANRGSSEVISSLWQCIQSSEEIKAKNHLIVWSDSCAGQNKNFSMICFYQYLILKGMFKVIDHKFPEVGHTYLDSDRDFGRIEKVLRKHENIVTPEQYRNIIKSAITKNSVVTDMENYFMNVENLTTNLGLVNKKKNTLNEKVLFRDGIKWIRVEEFGSYFYKESYDENTPFKTVCILKNPNGTAPNNFDLQPQVNKIGSVSKEKIQNLQTQLPFVATEHRWFYEQLFLKFANDEPAEKRKRTK